MEIKAYAKINITLDVLGLRSDGYHELETIMHTIDLYDTVHIEKNDVLSVEADFELPENSISKKAAKLYMERAGCGAAKIKIEGRIPNEAGLGGASADAAAVLKGMKAVYGALSEAEIYDIAKALGADVPFAYMGGCAIARGIGERLERLETVDMPILIVKPREGISTKYLFSLVSDSSVHPNSLFVLNAIKAKDIEAIAKGMKNSLEEVAIEYLPEIAEIKRELVNAGALNAVMTGSGSSVVGAFENHEKALKAFQKTEKMGKGYFTYLGKTI